MVCGTNIHYFLILAKFFIDNYPKNALFSTFSVGKGMFFVQEAVENRS